MKKLRLTIAAGALALAMTATQAQAACYTAAEFEAEQGLRIHSELMVIGLTCLKMPGGSGLYAKYQHFTEVHQGLIGRYEGELINYFRKQGSAQPEKDFHSLRTGLANRISKLAIGNMVGFCKAFSPRLDAALKMDDAKIRRWATQVWADAPTSRPVCR